MVKVVRVRAMRRFYAKFVGRLKVVWVMGCFVGGTQVLAWIMAAGGVAFPGLLALAADSGGASQGERIVIRADQDLGSVKHLHGILHGVTFDGSAGFGRTVELLSKLKPRFWRLSSHNNNVYDFVVSQGRFPERFRTQITFVIQDAFNVRYGFPIEVSPSCPRGRRNCFTSYDELTENWVAVVEQVMQQSVGRYRNIDYFDIFGEPNWGWKGIKPKQLLELFRLAYDTIRRNRPDAKIVGPSLGFYERKRLETFLTHAVSNNLRLDVLSWHEFKFPDMVPGHVQEMRDFFKGHPSMCRPSCPEIHINEYADGKNHLIPGWEVGWLFYFEKAGVDQIHRACWDVRGGWSTCWHGFNGLFLKDNVTPTNLYWVHREYAEMSGRRLHTESTMARTVALASRDDSSQEVRILAGRYGNPGQSGNVTLVVEGYPYAGSQVRVQVKRIPNNNNQPVALHEPILVSTKTLSVEGRTVSLSLDDFADGDAFVVLLRP